MMQHQEKPQYIIFAGVNGAGKSTFFQSGCWEEKKNNKIARINSDEILREFGGDFKKSSDQLKAGKIAYKKIKACLEQKQSFNQETTLTGHAIIRNIKKAYETGFEVNVYYIGVDSPEIALSRINQRVERGGHSVAEADVRRRFESSIKNVLAIKRYCHRLLFIDNSEQFMPLAAWCDGVLCWWGGLAASKHRWFIDLVHQRF